MKRISGLIALFLLIAVPAVANAHQGNSDYRSEVTSIRPEALARGLEVKVVNFDDHVRLENRTGKDIVILGYEGEPLARILADGTVEENLNSPSFYLNQDRFADVDLPERAEARATPDWKQTGENGIYEWHDHRSHFMGEGTPPQVKDESERTKVFDYTIPIRVAGKPVKVSGTLTWAGKDSGVPVIPFLILGLAILAAIGYWVLRRRREGEMEAAPATGPGKGEETDGEGREAW